MPTVSHSDIHIDRDMISLTIMIEIDGKSYAISTSLTVQQAVDNAIEDYQPPFTIVEL